MVTEAELEASRHASDPTLNRALNPAPSHDVSTQSQMAAAQEAKHVVDPKTGQDMQGPQVARLAPGPHSPDGQVVPAGVAAPDSVPTMPHGTPTVPAIAAALRKAGIEIPVGDDMQSAPALPPASVPVT